MKEIPQDYITIHHALFSEQYVVTIGNIDYPIQKSSIGCRYVDFNGTRIIQQSKYGLSEWAKKARSGKAISWAKTFNQEKTIMLSEIRIDSETINSTKS